MAVDYKPSMTKDELLQIAVTNGITVNDGMTKKQIIAALDVCNEAENATESTEGSCTSADGKDAQDSARGQYEGPRGKESQKNVDKGAGRDTKGASGDSLFVYSGPTLPRGRLKENAVFRGTRQDVLLYLSDVLKDYPQVEKLVIPAQELAAFSAKLKPGNAAYKYYHDIASAMRGCKEV